MKDLTLCMKENGERTKSLLNLFFYSIAVKLFGNCLSLQHPHSDDLLRCPKHFHPAEPFIKEFPSLAAAL